jgi:hypothetical protein
MRQKRSGKKDAHTSRKDVELELGCDDNDTMRPRILLRGFPLSWRETEIRLVFATFGGADSVTIFGTSSRREAYVTLKDYQNSAQVVKKLDNTEVGDGDIMEQCTISCKLLAAEQNSGQSHRGGLSSAPDIHQTHSHRTADMATSRGRQGDGARKGRSGHEHRTSAAAELALARVPLPPPPPPPPPAASTAKDLGYHAGHSLHASSHSQPKPHSPDRRGTPQEDYLSRSSRTSQSQYQTGHNSYAYTQPLAGDIASAWAAPAAPSRPTDLERAHITPPLEIHDWNHGSNGSTYPFAMQQGRSSDAGDVFDGARYNHQVNDHDGEAPPPGRKRRRGSAQGESMALGHEMDREDARVEREITKGMALIHEARKAAAEGAIEESCNRYVLGLQRLLGLDKSNPRVEAIAPRLARYVEEAEKLQRQLAHPGGGRIKDPGMEPLRERSRSRSHSASRRHGYEPSGDTRHKRRVPPVLSPPTLELRSRERRVAVTVEDTAAQGTTRMTP